MKFYIPVQEVNSGKYEHCVFSNKEKAQAYCDFVNGVGYSEFIEATTEGQVTFCYVEERIIDEVPGFYREEFGLWLLDRAMGVGDE